MILLRAEEEDQWLQRYKHREKASNYHPSWKNKYCSISAQCLNTKAMDFISTIVASCINKRSSLTIYTTPSTEKEMLEYKLKEVKQQGNLPLLELGHLLISQPQCRMHR